MTLVGKGSRLITVDGVVYRWRVRGRPTYWQAIGQAQLAVSVQLEEADGAALICRMPQAHPSNWVGRPAVPVLPSTVAGLIRQALGQGWQPDHRGPAFQLRASQP